MPNGHLRYQIAYDEECIRQEEHLLASVDVAKLADLFNPMTLVLSGQPSLIKITHNRLGRARGQGVRGKEPL